MVLILSSGWVFTIFINNLDEQIEGIPGISFSNGIKLWWINNILENRLKIQKDLVNLSIGPYLTNCYSVETKGYEGISQSRGHAFILHST